MIYPATNKSIELAINSLQNGEIIVYPTDTLYGFGVDATNTEAIKKLNQLKGRAQSLSVIIDDIQNISKFSNITQNVYQDRCASYKLDTQPFNSVVQCVWRRNVTTTHV